MSIESGLVAYLKGQPGLAALVAARIYPLRPPKPHTHPLIYYQRISSPSDLTQDGASGLSWPRFQFTVEADDYDGVIETSEMLSAALNGYKGPMGNAHVGLSVVEEDGRDVFDAETQHYQRQLDAVIWYNYA